MKWHYIAVVSQNMAAMPDVHLHLYAKMKGSLHVCDIHVELVRTEAVVSQAKQGSYYSPQGFYTMSIATVHVCIKH